MPIIKTQNAVELARGVIAFLKLEAGLVHGSWSEVSEARLLGELDDRRRRAEQQVAGREKQLGEMRSQLERLRKQLKNREDRISSLRGRLREATAIREDESDIVNQFHRLYYEEANTSGGTWKNTYWMGVPVWKCPLDLWVYQEIIFDQRPDVIIETGTAFGGSALFMAHVCDVVDNGRILTVDIKDKPDRPRHERIEYLHGSSTSEEVVQHIGEIMGDVGNILVTLDSNHSMEHVLRELEIYSKFVKKGGYIIVEDTNANGHPVLPRFGPGPMEATQKFLQHNSNFVVDESQEKFYMTFNPKGFLKRVA